MNNILLDTQAFLWWSFQPATLSPVVYAACNDPSNRLIVSVASIWEIQTKMAKEQHAGGGDLLKMLPNDAAIDDLIATQKDNGIRFQSIMLRHVRRSMTLPWIHKDPWDRLIIATAVADGLVLASSDTRFPDYVAAGVPLHLFW